MNRPRRPGSQPPQRRRPAGPPATTNNATNQPQRRRSPLDTVPQGGDYKFLVLGTGVDRQALTAAAQPMELVVVHGFTREIEDAFQKSHGRPDDFWRNHQHLMETARKLDELLGRILSRRGR